MKPILVILAAATFGLVSLCQPLRADAPAPGAMSVHDVVVYGDSSGAVIAAIAAKREGRSVIWVNPTGFPGGMSASGLGATDFLGYRSTFGGIASEFYDGVAKAYRTNYVRSFEPHVGKQVFEQMIADAGVTVIYNEKLDRTPGKGVTMDGKRIKAVTTLSGKTYHGKMFIDATYVGDLMAAAGVTYTVGREPESQYGEDMAGVRRGDTSPRVHYGQKDKDHFVKEVDPYVKPGDPSSGLLPHIHHSEGLKNGQGDKKIQAYNYRVCLTTNPANRIPIEKPPGYREIDHELLLRNFDAGDTRLPALVEPLQGGQKVDWNNMHAVGSDFVGANWDYPEASYERRREIEKEHETYIRGFLWTMANNHRVPEAIRKRTATYGLPKDEFTDNGGWPWMIYIREARRMVGDYIMTQLDCEGKRKAPDPVGLGSFGMDSHCVQHIVTANGKVQNEGVIWRVPQKPYGISYRSIIPKRGECENLFSPICLSASHVAHGSIRMEPVFMTLSQSAAIAAGLALDSRVSVQDVPYPALREKLEAAKQIMRPEAWKKSTAPKNSPPQKPSPKKSAATGNQTTAKTNIILILADDLGAKELSCYGNKEHQTPHLDRMASEGMRFETFYATPLCTPTRVALMTGQYGFHSGFLGMQDPAFRPAPNSPQSQIGNHFTHADLLKSRGYATALAGKWQLSGELPTLVHDAGFDEYRMWAYDHNLPPGIKHPAHEGGGNKGNACRYWHPSIVENGKYLPTMPGDYGPDLFNNFVVDFARRHKDGPFFVYYTSVLTHNPHLETPDPAKPGARWPATFKSNLEYLDHLMGKLLAALKAGGLDENTLVIFMGDNGTGGSGKGTVTELGVRVPCIIRGPGVKRGVVCRALGDLTDIMPTLAEFSGAKLPKDRPFDGHSLGPVLRGEKEKHRDWIYSHLDDGRVLRNQRWLLEIAKRGKGEKFFDCGKSRDGTGYKDVTDSTDPEIKAARARFDEILAKMPEPKPREGVEPNAGKKKQTKKEDGTSGKSAAQTTTKPAADRVARFGQRDKNHDGLISHDEFISTLAGSDKAAGEARFKKLDANHDGSITKEEFLANGVKTK